MNFLQDRIASWMSTTFSESEGADGKERGFRFGEEALELLQANGCSKEDVLKLVEYVYGRPVGHLPQEVGGTMLTLGAFCNAVGINMIEEARTEIIRCETPQVRAKIQAKQAMKREVMGYSPLPGSVVDAATAHLGNIRKYVTLQQALAIPVNFAEPGFNWLPQQSVWKVVGSRYDEHGTHWLAECVSIPGGTAVSQGVYALPVDVCSDPREAP